MRRFAVLLISILAPAGPARARIEISANAKRFITAP